MATDSSAGIVYIWTGTNANIPSGFERDTDFDGRYVYGCSSVESSGGTTGGLSTHIHTTTPHTHNLTGGASEESTFYINGGKERVAQPTHSHIFSRTASANPSLIAVANDPDYYEVIFISSLGSNKVPMNAVAFFDEEVTETDWYECDGTNSTPNLQDRYLKGAEAGQNAGSTGSGNHTHNLEAHTHGITVSGSYFYSLEAITDGKSGSGVIDDRHTHQVISQENDTVTSSSGEIEPPYRSLRAYQNQNQEEIITGTIALWKGDKAAIPEDWEEVTEMRDVFVQVKGNVTTGGSATHTHTMPVHKHTGFVDEITLGRVQFSEEESAAVSPSNHTHAWDYSSSGVSVSSTSTTPPYIKVFFIKYTAVDVIVCDASIELEQQSSQVSLSEEQKNITVVETNTTITNSITNSNITIEEDEVTMEVCQNGS